MVTMILIGAGIVALQGFGLWVACRLVGPAPATEIPAARVPREFVSGEWDTL
jgi:hypothetical protein